MSTIVTRSGKGSALSWAEADANFTNLNNDKIETSEIGVTVQPYDADALTATDIGVTVQAYDATIVVDADIGVTVQGYDADTAKLDVDQAWTGAQRGTVTTDNDGSFDLSATNNFACTPSGDVTLTFTNHTSGQSGFILFDNTGAHDGHALAATTKADSNFLSTINAAGVYLISYFDNGTNAYVTTTGNLT